MWIAGFGLVLVWGHGESISFDYGHLKERGVVLGAARWKRAHPNPHMAPESLRRPLCSRTGVCEMEERLIG